MIRVMADPAQQSSAESLLTEAERQIASRNFAGAQQSCLRLLKGNPGHSDAHFLLGIIAAELGRFGNAVEFIEAAIKLEPTRAEFHAHLGRCLAMQKRDSEARTAAERAVALSPNDALTLDTIGVVLSRIGEHGAAVKAFEQAIARDRRNPGYQFNLGSSLKFIGDFERAEQAYEAAIDASPRFYKAHSALSALRRQSGDNNHIARLEGLLPGARDVDAQLHLHHSLAKEYDDLGNYAAAFEHLRAGNKRKRDTLDYDVNDDLALFDRVRDVFSAEWLAGQSIGHDSREPVFVLGMPRTGTTLVERVISSHSQVFSAGELQNFPLTVKRMASTPSKQVLDTGTLTAAADIDPKRLGLGYLESTRPATGQSPRFVDKMPLNYFYIGLIHAALPNAKIVCLRRHPLDTCLSNFRQLFALKFSYYNYAFDLEDIAHYYVGFAGLMQHWHKVLPNVVLEVDYERLVADQETESRRILEHCELDWEDACLDFDKNTSPVATASSAQVRGPIYSSAIARWKRYDDFLGPAKRILATSGFGTG